MIDFLISLVVFAAMAALSIGLVCGTYGLANSIQERKRKDRQ